MYLVMVFSRKGNGRGRGLTDTATVGTVQFCDVRKDSRATSAMMDVPADEQELPEPVRLRAMCVVPDEREKLGRWDASDINRPLQVADSNGK